MSTETEIANLALGKVGGAGDALDGNAFITSINGDDKVSSWLKLNFPRVRRTVIKDLALAGAPFRSTLRFADLGSELSSTPEIANWTYAFNLPGDTLLVMSQFSEDSVALRNQPADYISDVTNLSYQFEMIANSAGTGLILLTDTLSNSDQTSAFISYVIDVTDTGAFNEEMIECIATLLANRVAPVIGRDMESALAMLQQYEQIAKPNAISANTKDVNNSARGIPNLKGGRSESLQGV